MTDATHKNMLVVMQHSKNNKVEIGELRSALHQIQTEKTALNQRVDALTKQVQHLQVAIFSGGPTA